MDLAEKSLGGSSLSGPGLYVYSWTNNHGPEDKASRQELPTHCGANSFWILWKVGGGVSYPKEKMQGTQCKSFEYYCPVS